MVVEWREYKLEDVIDINMGQSPKSEYYNSIGDGTPFLQGNRTFGYKYPFFDTFTTHPTKIAEANDVIMSVRAPVGDLNMTPSRICIGRGVCALRMKNGNQNYLFYLMKFLTKQLLNKESGTVFGSVNKNDIAKLEISLPDNKIQQKIAKVLGAIDDKIELNNKINENLEQQMDLFYKSIFENDYNTIELGSVIETTSGGTPSRKILDFYNNGKINWIKSKELLGTYIVETEEKITEEAIVKSAAKILPKETVLLAMYGATVGAYGIISKEMSCNQAICGLIQNENYPYSYIFENIKLSNNVLKNMAVGSAQQNISQVLIKQLPVHSDLNKIRQYSAIANKFMRLILNIQQENQNLAQLRDTLLPKLMSGEIDVEKVEV